MPYSRGEVVLVLFPDSNLRTLQPSQLYTSELIQLIKSMVSQAFERKD